VTPFQRIRLGLFDPPERVPYTKIPYSENDSAVHRQLARDAERQAMVLLKNEGGILPLKSTVRKIAVIGPSADDPVGLLGNYNGISSRQVRRSRDHEAVCQSQRATSVVGR